MPLIKNVTMINKKKYRDLIRLFFSILFSIVYIPHLLLFFLSSNKKLIESDVSVLKIKLSIRLNTFFGILFFLHNNPYFRVIFYHRIGPIRSLIIEWYRPGFNSFIISKSTVIEAGFNLVHPYSTIINAEHIGKNFNFRHCTTLGNKLNDNKRPFIGDNVTLGASVTIIGDIKIGDNVIIGAGAVVTRNIEKNSIAVGNPAKVIKKIN